MDARYFIEKQLVLCLLQHSSFCAFKFNDVDFVCVFSPYRTYIPMGPVSWRTPQWRTTLFSQKATKDRGDEYERLNRIAAALPKARLEAYQARSWHQQGLFDPQGVGMYLGTMTSSKGGGLGMSISISSRMVLELLAGRISQKEFEEYAFGRNKNLFDLQMKFGNTIQEARLEKSGVDEDDDKIVFELELDPGATPFRNPKG